MKRIITHLFTAAVLTAATFSLQKASAATFLWSGASSPDLNWTTPGNWSPSGPPAGGDTAIFGDGATVADATTVNNIVDVSTNITGLSYTNATSGTWHVTQIPSGVKLTASGSLTVGGINADGAITSAAMVGGGTFEADGSAFKVGNAGSSSTSTLRALLDMSGLNNFIYNASGGTWIVAGSGSEARGGGVLNLAGVSNNITVGTISFNTGSGNNSGFHSLIQLGAGTNIINVGTFNVCQTKAQFATVQFIPGAPATAGLRLRGVNGNSDDTSRANIALGDRNNTGSANTDGELLLNGYRVDIKAGTLTVGQDRSGGGSSTHGGVGIVQFDTGTIDATTINMAVSTSVGTSSSATGTITVGGTGTLVVGTNGISLGNKSGGSTGATATLNVNGGTVNSSGKLFKANSGAVANINMTGGILNMGTNTIGTSATPIDNVSFTDSTISVPVSDTATVNAITLTAFGTANTINISSVPLFFSYPAQFPIIAYQIPGGDNNTFVAGTIPGGFMGYISNNVTTSTIDLVITNGPTLVTLKSINWNGAVNGNWDTTTKNWITNGVQTNYFQHDFVTFSDTLAGTTNVILTTSLTPGDLTINNSQSNYLFTGTGKLNGDTGLLKQGAGTLILANSGTNDFTGSVVISGGTLQIGNADSNGNLPPGNIQDDGTLAFNRTNNITFTNAINGIGSLSQLGSGKLTLTIANTYSGNTTVANGTLALTGAGAISASGLTSVRNGTLDVSAMTATTLALNSISLTNGSLVLGSKTLSASALNLSNATITLSPDINAGAAISVPALAIGGTTNYFNITSVQNVPDSPTLPLAVPLISYSALAGNFNFGVLTIPNAYITNNVANSTIDAVFTAAPFLVTWNGGSATGNYWSDAANWSGTPIVPTDTLMFDGNGRLNNTNDTAPLTEYNNIIFNAGAGAFTLNGNSISGAGITNNSPNPQTIDLALNFGRSIGLNGGTGGLFIGGGLTNTLGAPGSTTLTLSGKGVLTNILGITTSPGGTNLILMVDPAADWTLMDNPSSTPMSVPWAFALNNGTFNFGTASSAPVFTTTSAQGVPQDDQIGGVAGSTGTLNISNGTFTTSARMNTGVAADATGIVNLYNGTLTVASQFQGANGSALSFSTVNVNGGTMNVGGTAGTGPFYVASRGTGTLNMNGGVVNCGTLDVSRNAAGNTAGSIGVVNLNGGLLSVNSVTTVSANQQAGGSPTATFNLNGGTLKAHASSATFFKGGNNAPAPPVNAFVQAGGAIIDTTNFNDTVVEPLQHDPALGGTPDGGLKKFGSGTLTLSGGNSYTGPTQIGEGTLFVGGSLDAASAVTVSNNATLAGNGFVGGTVLVKSGGTISPAGINVIGTLSVGGAVTLQGTTHMEVNRDTASSDLLSAGSISYGGTLQLVNLGSALQIGDQFTLFSPPGSLSGSFTVSGPAGVQWDTSTLATDGIIKVSGLVDATPTNIAFSVSGNQLTLSWPADHTGWRLQVQTNSITTGLSSNWVDVPGSTTVNSVNFTISPANGSVFFRMVYP